jgi:hypothetical protein
MEAAGDGATGFALIRQESGVLHAINVVNRGGKVYFIDSQRSRIVTLPPMMKIKLGMP